MIEREIQHGAIAINMGHVDIIKRGLNRVEMKTIWREIAIGAICLLAGGAPSYFSELPKRPTREEVSTMIVKEAPAALQTQMKEIVDSQNAMNIQSARLTTMLENVIMELQRESAGRRR